MLCFVAEKWQKLQSGWGSAPAPDGGAYSAPPYPHAGREGLRPLLLPPPLLISSTLLLSRTPPSPDQPTGLLISPYSKRLPTAGWFSNHRTLQIVGTVYKIHSSKVSIIGDASCVRFDFLYIVAIFYDVNSLSGSLKYAELPFPL